MGNRRNGEKERIQMGARRAIEQQDRRLQREERWEDIRNSRYNR